MVGESAFLEADIRASRLIISGEVHGNISAMKKIEINSQGKVLGNISAPIITIQEGGIFEGACKMQGKGEINEVKEKVKVLRGDSGKVGGDDKI